MFIPMDDNMTERVLIVEDEPKAAESFRKWLEENNFGADIAPDGAVGKHLALSEKYDLVLLDLNLPYISGYEVCREIKNQKPQMPVILVTALGGIDQKLGGFDAGADDYIVKPFDFRELMARMRLLLRRAKDEASLSGQDGLLRVADLEMNLAFKTVRRGNTLISLTAKEFALLEFLMKKSGKVASRYEIVEEVWDVNFDTGTNVVDVYINFLRRKIDKNFEPKLIHTKQGMGYFIKYP
jgi:two-component system, OmpR family, copper resistance phosphate regulon response regulator CusR